VRSRSTAKFRALYQSAPKAIQDKAKAAYQLWSENPDHPSLRFKKVHNKLPIYSVRVDLDWRAVGVMEGDVSYGSGSGRTTSMKSFFASSSKRSNQRMNTDAKAAGFGPLLLRWLCASRWASRDRATRIHPMPRVS